MNTTNHHTHRDRDREGDLAFHPIFCLTAEHLA
jgi:hypothetical protein